MGVSPKKSKLGTTRRKVNPAPRINLNMSDEERHFLSRFPDDDTCLEHLLRLRFGARIECPKCQRSAKFHKIRQIPAYACQWCGYHLHPMAQTRFARSRVGLRLWFHAVFHFAHSERGLSARELQNRLGLTYKTAWRMRNTIVDARFHLSGTGKQAPPVDFERLLRMLASPNDKSANNRSLD